MIKVSIVVPVYNVEKYISKCLDSLINQSLEEIEIIVVNDGSTDDSQNIIDDYVIKYPQKIKSFIKSNGGLSDARNFGLQYCTGEYIGFIDSDDYLDKHMYEEMYEVAKKDNNDIVMCDYYKVYNKKRELVKAKKYQNRKEMFIDTLAAAWNKIYKKELLENSGVAFPLGLIYEDTEFFCKLIPYIKSCGYVPKPFVYYVQRRESIANTQGLKIKQIFLIMDNIINYYKEIEEYEEYKAELEYLYIRILLGSSMERISRVKDKDIRSILVKETYELINDKFPEWKRNYYLSNLNTKRHIYMRTINKYSIKFYTLIFSFYFSYKERGLY